MPLDAVTIEARRGFTRSQARGILFNQGGCCAGCGEVVNLAKKDRFEIDHRIPLAVGGTNDWSNLQALCAPCHRAKTGADVTTIAKAKRVGKKFRGEFRRPRHELPGGKNSSVRIKLNGSVIARATGAVIRAPRFTGDRK